MRQRRLKPIAGEPEGLGLLLRRYLAHLEARNYARETLRKRKRELGAFVAWCEERGVVRAEEVDRGLVEQYQRHLFHHRKKNGEPLCVANRIDQTVQVRQWFAWMVRQGKLKWNPASEVELPRKEHRLPKGMLSAREAETVLAVPDLGTPLGLRDRAMLEALYSTGLRRSELLGLRLRDVDWERGTVLVVQGKGKKDRMVPIGERALLWVRKYRDEVRPGLVLGKADGGVLFLSARGRALTGVALTRLARDYVAQAGLGGRGACHLFRHTAATLMLENGADIRFIQELLGHADLAATQVYTRVSIRALKAAHARTRPGQD